MRRAATLAPTLLVLLALSATVPAQAQWGRETSHALQGRFGWFWPAGGGELWDTNEEVFTLSASDFDGFTFGFSYVHSLNNSLEVGANIDWHSQSARSDYRHWKDEGWKPILHDTRLSMVPLTVDLRVLPGGRLKPRPGGRKVLKPVFYLGVGAGVNFWTYEEQGDFLDFDFDPPEIFYGRFKDSGEAFEVHALAGVEFPVSPGFNFLTEIRYSWAEDTLGGAFAGLGKLKLDGFGLSLGGSWRF